MNKIKNINWKSKPLNYVIMAIMVFSWGYEYILAKHVLVYTQPITLVFFKYGTAFLTLLIVKLIVDRKNPIRKNHIYLYLLCSIFGEILYFAFEYTAMDYLPVSIITIVLTFVPALAIVIEWFLYKRKPTVGMVIGIAVCIVGVCLVVGPDATDIIAGSGIGYMLAFFAVISWNIYNFITERLCDTYSVFDLTLIQIGASALVSFPYAVFNMPPLAEINGYFIFTVLYLGGFASVVGFLIYVNALGAIGVTPVSLFSNMLPVTTTFFGYFLLKEMIGLVQIIGGVIVISAGAAVIYLKGKQLNKEKLDAK